MSISRKIRKIFAFCVWGIAGTGLVVLLIAAVNSRSRQVCRGYEIDINGQKDGQWFIDKEDIVNVLTANKTLAIKNRAVASIDLDRIEARLKREDWVRDAELYFDNNGILKVWVEEREPVARIFSSSGESFYIDSTGRRLPLSDKLAVKLPVFTGFPGNGRKWKSADKKLVQQIKDLSLYVLNNPFWMAQVSQVDITPRREFEIVPTIGNHIIEFGDGSDYEKKFNRLFVFYKQVMAKAGMEKYERIKVQYDGQVIGVK